MNLAQVIFFSMLFSCGNFSFFIFNLELGITVG